jgi:O-antigen biosynthesis protein
MGTTYQNTLYLSSYNSPHTNVYGDTIGPIAAGADGVKANYNPFSSSNVMLTNQGYIRAAAGTATGSGGVGVDLLAPATIVNQPGYGYDGYYNGGRIYGGHGASGAGGAGISMANGGSIANYKGAVIQGGSSASAGGGTGVDLSSGLRYGFETIAGVLNNFGTISGGAGESGGIGLILSDASANNGSSTNKSFSIIEGGTATGGSGGAAVELISPDDSITNFGTLKGGTSTTGTGGVGVYLDGGTVTTYGLIEGGNNVGNATSFADAVQFGAAPGKLVLEAGASFKGDIAGFETGDTIDIPNVTAAQVQQHFSFTGGSGATLTTPSDGTLQFTGNFTGEGFQFTPIDNGAGTEITIHSAACYRVGTLIRTPHGEASIETLRIGDWVMTVSGAPRPIRWIGRRTYSGPIASGNGQVLPILFRAGSLGERLPQRDLWVSPGHAMWVDGMLIPARALVNGTSIVQEKAVDEVTYIHIEFNTHDVIYAEGAPSESFVDDESRLLFDNAAEYWTLYPGARPEHARLCAQLVEEGEALEAVRQRLAARGDTMEDGASQDGAVQDAAMQAPGVRASSWRGHLDVVQRGHIEGWAQDEQDAIHPVMLRILVNGVPMGNVLADRYREDLQTAGIGNGYHAFSFTVPGGLEPDGCHVIDVQRVDDGRALRGSPYVMMGSVASLPAS